MDGLALKRLASDWQQSFVGARIERIHQPADRSIVLTLRANQGTKRILISAHRTYARAHALSLGKPENPLQPPMFCMVLRKRLETGRIVEIAQPGWERILQFWIEARDEKGDLVRYALIAELMGKHSNIILAQAGADGGLKIVDSIMHVGYDLSRVRQVMPGLHYTAPPALDKQTIEAVAVDALAEVAAMNQKDATRQLMRLIHGVGPVTATEVWHRANISVDGMSAKSLAEQLRQVSAAAMSAMESPSIGQSELGKPLACAPFQLTAWPSTQSMATFDEALEQFYAEFAAEAAQSQRQHDLARTIEGALDRLRGKRVKLESEFERGQDHDADRIKGEVLTAFAWQVEKGQTEVSLPNFYNEDVLIQIPLDPAKTAIENAQALFKRASKRKRAFQTLESAIAETNEDIRYLEQCLYLLSQGDAVQAEELREELVSQGFAKPVRKRAGKGKSDNGKHSGLDFFLSSDGWTIRVGRNNLQNDRLTFRNSRPDDLWLHVKDGPGSHVVIERKGDHIPETTVDEAALLAAYFSKSRDSANVPVDVTEIKNVWKPKGARPGLALYKGQTTLYATPDRKFVAEIQSRSAAVRGSTEAGQPSNNSSRRSR
jgi:predicted ribosome quality control (RQC) complex YloA/Tae2 family protein